MKSKVTFLLIAALLAGCASYESEPLSNLMVETPVAKDDVVVVAKSFDRADCQRYLDRDVIEEGYQPVQLFIQNNTDKNYTFSLSRMTIPYARSEEVADKVHTSTVGRAVGYGAAALFIWPFAIPAIVDGVKSAKANKNLDIDFSSKTARDQTIAPRSHYNKLIFVPRSEYQSNFSVTLIDQETAEPKTLTVSAR